MYNRRFFRTRLGQAAAASITVMMVFALLTTWDQPAMERGNSVPSFAPPAPIVAGILELA